MPNTQSAERRMHSSRRKELHNHSIKSKLGTLEKNYLALLGAGKKDQAAAALRQVTAAFDKAAKTGVIHKSRADRKKSRLTQRLNAVAAA